jgi:hypothetical protein
MKKRDIKLGFEGYGKRWGGLVWLVNDLTRKREGKRDHYCVLGHSPSGWWHLKYGTLAECRQFIFEEVR